MKIYVQIAVAKSKIELRHATKSYGGVKDVIGRIFANNWFEYILSLTSLIGFMWFLFRREMKETEKSRMRFNKGIKLDPNDWFDALWYYDDEPEVYDFMVENEDRIRRYARENSRTLKDSIDILFKEEGNDQKEPKGI